MLYFFYLTVKMNCKDEDTPYNPTAQLQLSQPYGAVRQLNDAELVKCKNIVYICTH